MITIREMFDSATFTMTYVVWDPATRDAVIIDPVADYDPASSTVTLASVEKVMAMVQSEKLTVHFSIETHAHADHLSGSQFLKKRIPKAHVAIGERITEVQSVFKPIFDLSSAFATDGSQFDRLLKDGEVIQAGSISIQTIFTPGHTPACASYKIGDAVFTGDTLFMPDSGVGRCDFPAGSAEALFDSVMNRLYALPDSVKTFTGHDYQPNGRAVQWQSTIGEQKRSNIHLKEVTTKSEFVRFRTERDKTLSAPRLLLPSVQINIDAGHLPEKRKDGRRYLTIPVSLRESE